MDDWHLGGFSEVYWSSLRGSQCETAPDLFPQALSKLGVLWGSKLTSPHLTDDFSEVQCCLQLAGEMGADCRDPTGRSNPL